MAVLFLFETNFQISIITFIKVSLQTLLIFSIIRYIQMESKAEQGGHWHLEVDGS